MKSFDKLPTQETFALWADRYVSTCVNATTANQHLKLTVLKSGRQHSTGTASPKPQMKCPSLMMQRERLICFLPHQRQRDCLQFVVLCPHSSATHLCIRVHDFKRRASFLHQNVVGHILCAFAGDIKTNKIIHIQPFKGFRQENEY